jgi:hypothetical protein
MHAGSLFSAVAINSLYNVGMKCFKAFMWCFFPMGSIKTVKIIFFNYSFKLFEEFTAKYASQKGFQCVSYS